MPWEQNGRRWHTVDRVGRQGEPCKWDGRILAKVVDRVHELGEFSPTDWNSRSVVEICAPKKADGWFFHAITGEEWLLKMKFRVAKRTFQRDDLVGRIGLKPLNEMPDLPIYGNEPRVKCRSIRGPWQEVELRVHSLDEIDRPQFWSFLAEAVRGFQDLTERKEQNPEDLMPWRVLGRKWHFARRGFPPGKTPKWSHEVLEELCEMIEAAAPGAQFLWQDQHRVRVVLPGQSEPWLAIRTKHVAALELHLAGPKGRFAFGRVANLGREPELATHQADRDYLKLKFVTSEDLHRGDLAGFLAEHAAAVAGAK
jgi:excinuclease ABC subunit A